MVDEGRVSGVEVELVELEFPGSEVAVCRFVEVVPYPSLPDPMIQQRSVRLIPHILRLSNNTAHLFLRREPFPELIPRDRIRRGRSRL